MTKLLKDFQNDHFNKTMIFYGLIEQLNTLVFNLYKEKKNIEEQIEKSEKNTIIVSKESSVSISVPFINSTYETAIKSSIIFFQFSIIEALVNLLSDLTIQVNNSVFFEPKHKLSQVEIDFLSEQITIFNADKKREQSKTSFNKLEDKLSIFPFLFGKMMNNEFQLDKSSRFWERFKQIKDKRDALTHPRNVRSYVEDEEIFDCSSIIYWLSENYFLLIRDCLYPKDNTIYKYIENSTSKLMKLSYQATSQKFSLKVIIEMQKKFKNKN